MSQTVGVDNPFERFPLVDLVGRQSLKWQAYPPDVLPLWVAEMDTDLAEPVRDAIITAVRRGEVGYPWGRAYPQALASFALDAWDWSLDPGTVRHTADVMTGMAHAVRLVTPPDGVLVLTTPVYPPFLDLPEIVGCAVRHVRLAADGRLDLDALAGAFAAIRAEGRAPTLALWSRVAGSRAVTSSTTAGPGTIRAAFSPGRLKAFEAECTAYARSAPATVRYGVKTDPGWTSGAWISSTTTRTPRSAASPASRSSSERVCATPVGLWGLHSARVGARPSARIAANAPARASRSSRPSAASRT